MLIEPVVIRQKSHFYCKSNCTWQRNNDEPVIELAISGVYESGEESKGDHNSCYYYLNYIHEYRVISSNGRVDIAEKLLAWSSKGLDGELTLAQAKSQQLLEVETTFSGTISRTSVDRLIPSLVRGRYGVSGAACKPLPK